MAAVAKSSLVSGCRRPLRPSTRAMSPSFVKQNPDVRVLVPRPLILGAWFGVMPEVSQRHRYNFDRRSVSEGPSHTEATRGLISNDDRHVIVRAIVSESLNRT